MGAVTLPEGFSDVVYRVCVRLQAWAHVCAGNGNGSNSDNTDTQNFSRTGMDLSGLGQVQRNMDQPHGQSQARKGGMSMQMVPSLLSLSQQDALMYQDVHSGPQAMFEEAVQLSLDTKEASQHTHVQGSKKFTLEDKDWRRRSEW